MRVMKAVLRWTAAVVLVGLTLLSLYGAAQMFILTGHLINGFDDWELKAEIMLFGFLGIGVGVAVAAVFWSLLRWVMKERYRLLSARQAMFAAVALFGIVFAVVAGIVGLLLYGVGRGFLWVADQTRESANNVLDKALKDTSFG